MLSGLFYLVLCDYTFLLCFMTSEHHFVLFRLIKLMPQVNCEEMIVEAIGRNWL